MEKEKDAVEVNGKVAIKPYISHATNGLLIEEAKKRLKKNVVSDICNEALFEVLSNDLELTLNRLGYKAKSLDCTESVIKLIDKDKLTSEQPCHMLVETKEYWAEFKFYVEFSEPDEDGYIEISKIYCPIHKIDSYLKDCNFECDIEKVINSLY